MSAKPESQFIASVHRHLPPEHEFHREKMANPYRAGTGDSWYSGTRADLWVEWKFIVLPKRPDTMIDLVGGKSPMLSVLQQEWITRRRAEGRNVWIGVGCKEGGVLLRDSTWPMAMPSKLFKLNLLTRPQIAASILEFCQGVP